MTPTRKRRKKVSILERERRLLVFVTKESQVATQAEGQSQNVEIRRNRNRFGCVRNGSYLLTYICTEQAPIIFVGQKPKELPRPPTPRTRQGKL